MPQHQETAGATVLNDAPALHTLRLFLLIFAAEMAAHAGLLQLPYYWDEAGYYIPAAFDFFRTASVIPFSTLTNAHPPGLSLYLAAAWKLFGFAPATTRVSMCLASAAALTAVWRLSASQLGARAALAVVALTAAYPVWFTQTTLAHADMLAAAATLWGLRFALSPSRRCHLWAAATCFTAAALTKEVAIGTPLALAGFEGVQRLRKQGSLRRAGMLCVPAAPLALWFAYHRWRTGFTFGNPEYLRYNATATLSPERFLLALAHRAIHLSAHLNLFVPVVIALGSLLLPRLAARRSLRPGVQTQIWIVIAANALLFSVLGGALLTRYLLPLYPLVLLLAVSAVQARVRRWVWFPLVSIAAFVSALVLPTPYRVAPEDTLAYRDAILLEQHAIETVTQDLPRATVLSAWPVTDGLRKPELGYVHVPMPVIAVDNFSLAALDQLRHSPQEYGAAIVFSTKYQPASTRFSFGHWGEQQEERFFDLHHDLSAGAAAALLGGSVLWQERRGAQWAAVLRMDHPQLAQAMPLTTPRRAPIILAGTHSRPASRRRP